MPIRYQQEFKLTAAQKRIFKNAEPKLVFRYETLHRFILEWQHARKFGLTGQHVKLNVNTLPLPGCDRTEISPRCFCIIWCEMLRPIPEPPFLVE